MSSNPKARKRGRMEKTTKKKKKKRANFQDYLEMELGKQSVPAEEDAAILRRLAKRLKLKRGKLDDAGDSLAELLDGLEAVGDVEEQEKDDGELSDQAGSSGESEMQQGSSDDEQHLSEGEDEPDSAEEPTEHEDERDSAEDKDDHKEHEENAEDKTVKYVPPHQRKKAASEDEVRLKRRVKGLLNRLSEDNVESVTSELADMFQMHSRKVLTGIITDHILDSCSHGPRGNEQYAAVFAACVSGIACLIGMDFGGNFLAGVASCFEEQYARDDGLSVRNLTLLISSLYRFSLISSEIIYDLLQHLCKRFNEIDVATILHLIQSCGMGLRNSDPSSMKDFILSVQERTSELKRSLSDGNEGMSKRVEFMLEAICEVKNNKRKAADEPARHTRLKKWLQKLRVEEVQLRSLTWKKLLDPAKKGQWWLGNTANQAQDAHVPKVVDLIDSGAAEAEKMLKLAASQRMNTDSRRAIFSIVMSSEDYIDAFEKLLRLTLTGKQDREIVRVIVECCLQEKVFNKYYALLASKLCHHDKNHKFSLQYCIWDHFKELPNMEARRSINLAKLLAALVSSSALSLTVLKAVDFADRTTMTAKVIVHFRTFLETLLTENDDSFVYAAFSRIAGSPELGSLQIGLAVFMRQFILQKKPETATDHSLLLQKRYQIAKKALSSRKL